MWHSASYIIFLGLGFLVCKLLRKIKFLPGLYYVSGDSRYQSQRQTLERVVIGIRFHGEVSKKIPPNNGFASYFSLHLTSLEASLLLSRDVCLGNAGFGDVLLSFLDWHSQGRLVHGDCQSFGPVSPFQPAGKRPH